MSLSKKIFYLIVFLLPLNLGKHFIFPNSLIDGLVIDYLIPTLYIQDLLVAFLIGTWFYELIFINKCSQKTFRHYFFNDNLPIYYFLIFSLLLSVFISPIFDISLYLFFRVFIYFLFFVYVYNTFNFDVEFDFLSNILILSFIFTSIIGILQFLKQSSVFNNYLILGEQPYSLSTRGITLENFLGSTVVPSYGLFRHPNIFGGFLSILSIWVLDKISKNKNYLFVFVLFILTLFFTFSYFSYISLGVGICLYYFLNKSSFLGIPLFVDFLKRKLVLIFVIFLFTFSLIFPFLKLGTSNTSLLRRSNLLLSSYQLLDSNFSYGVGFGTFVYTIQPYLGNFDMKAILFLQPVHNIFILVLVESGVMAFMFLIFIFVSTFMSVKNILLFVSLTQLIFLSLFDHYFWTIHQPYLFAWLLLALCWTTVRDYSYNK